jgi:diguanylate cyclase (GGDEF)-like protein
MVNARLSRVEIYKEMASSDGLTGFYNQKATKEYLCAEVIRADRLNIPLSVGFMDIDLFRKVNERFGHPSGDSVLKTVAETLRGMMNKEDVAGRWGGEEFLLILPGNGESEALVRLENIREKISRLTFPDKELTVSFSIGVATYPGDALTAEELVKKADMALLRAKKTGRNRVVSFSSLEKKEV